MYIYIYMIPSILVRRLQDHTRVNSTAGCTIIRGSLHIASSASSI